MNKQFNFQYIGYSKLNDVIAIVATDLKNGIGKDNQLLWHLPNDLKQFKKLTLNQVVIMGRNTFESIGRPLPNRTNVVLSKHPTAAIKDVKWYSDIDLLLKELPMKYPDKQLIVIGGAQIYKLLYPYIQEIHRTLVHYVFDADTFFPDFERDFECLKSNFHTKDEKHLYDFEFQYWKRKNKR